MSGPSRGVFDVVKLKTSDGKRFTMSKSEAFCSNALKSMLASSSNTVSDIINLPSVHSDMLVKVKEWCQNYCTRDSIENEPLNDTTQRLETTKLTDWQKVFLDSMSEEELFKLTHVSNYLDIRSLFDACCRVIGKRWEGKKVEEIRQMYNIENDFAPDEEHQMLLENKKLGLDN